MAEETETKNYVDVCVHSGLEKVADDLYIVSGSFNMAPLFRIGLNMIIVKEGNDLTIINSMRVSKEVETEIEKLGTVKNIVRIIDTHGASDQYYVDTFKNATYWDVPGQDDTKTPKADKVLTDSDDDHDVDGNNFPVKGSKVLLMKNVKFNEAVVWIPQGGGTVISADFIQNGRTNNPSHESFVGNIMTTYVLGFKTGRCGCPPLYRKLAKTENEDDIYKPNVPRILELDFKNILSAHGPPQMGDAKEDLKKGFDLIKSDEKLWKSSDSVADQMN